MVEIDSRIDSYSSKIVSLIESSNLDYFVKELIWQPHLSMGVMYQGMPLLNYIGRNILMLDATFKTFELFVNGIFHFSERVLGFNGKTGSGKEFLTTYLNFNQCNDLINYVFFVCYDYIAIHLFAMFLFLITIN